MTKFRVGDLVTRHPDHLGSNWGVAYKDKPGQVLCITRVHGDGRFVAFDNPEASWKAVLFLPSGLENE